MGGTAGPATIRSTTDEERSGVGVDVCVGIGAGRAVAPADIAPLTTIPPELAELLAGVGDASAVGTAVCVACCKSLTRMAATVAVCVGMCGAIVALAVA